ncbi:HAD family hydrolase [Aeromicrobium sp.]|uniref:HAD family hydrolase n=1 Tax=Aeromicrobium sp. TaxID=1871063 RepID=UPI0028A8D8B0|nr:HAD family hydrolase [Aeromicrobium sp.]
MTWRPKLVALDVDGTIVNHLNELSPSVKEAVLAIRAQGIPVVIATGRAVPGVYDVLDKLGFREGLGIASNGSVVFEVDPFELVHTTTFDAREAVRRVLERVPEALVAVEEVGVGYRVNRAFPHGEITGEIILDEVERMVSQPVTRVVVRAPDHSREEFSAMVEDLGLDGTNYYIGYTAWLDLAPEGVSKASGLDEVCRRMGLTAADVLAVGDGNNDLEMIQWAGRGVAMAQGSADLIAVADDVAGPVEEDGLADELRRWLD